MHFRIMLPTSKMFFLNIHLILNDLSGITESMKLGSKEVAFLSISKPFF